MTCAKCGGLVVNEYGARHCLNCGFDPDLVLRQPDGNDLDEPEPRKDAPTMGKWSDETRAAFKEKLRAAWANKRKGGGVTAQVSPGHDGETVEASSPVKTCGVAGCKKPRLADSTQCERHYQKSLRNNIKYRARAKTAMEGAGGGDWKSQALSALISQREMLAAKMREIDTVMTAIKGM